MSIKQHKESRLRWWKSAFGYIADKHQEKLDKDAALWTTDKSKKLAVDVKDHLKWRLGFNLYKAGRYFEAIDYLTLIANGGEAGKVEHTNRKKKRARLEVSDSKTSKTELEELDKLETDEPIEDNRYIVHLTLARCCVEMFKETHQHYHLEVAYKAYTMSVERMPAGLIALFQLPPVLYEFAIMMELYGAFESALEIYSKLLTKFPTWRGYFDAMYRCALVGRTVSEMQKEQEKKDTILNKSVDMLQFLLEAVPNSIQPTHIVLLFARSMETSSDPNLRYRATGIYQSLYDYLKNIKDKRMNVNVDKFNNFKEWNAEPLNFLELGDQIAEQGEYAIARDAYEVFYNKVDEAMTFGDKAAKKLLSPDVCIRIAKNYSKFQNYSRAITFADIGLKANHFHKETRACLSRWSNVHAKLLNREQHAIDNIEEQWRSRVWSKKYRKRITAKIVSDNEEKIDYDYLDIKARAQLAYYARDKWRASFLFEEECARRIQHNFRQARMRWQWLAGIRAKYLRLASEAYRKFFKDPMNYNVREDIRSICASRFAPSKHAILKLIAILDVQDKSAESIRRAFQAYRRRKALYERQRQRWLDELNEKNKFATYVQCMFRARIAKKLFHRRLVKHKKKVAAATVIQKYMKTKWATFRGAAHRLLGRIRWTKKLAARSITVILPYAHKKRKELLKRLAEEAELKRLEEERIEAARLLAIKQRKAALKIQWRWREYQGAALKRLALQLLKMRGSARFSRNNKIMLARMTNEIECHYTPPGVRQSTPQFNKMLTKSEILCSGNSDHGFESSDVMMLGLILKNHLCRCTTLVLEDVDGRHAAFEFDLLSAISQCRSLRNVVILGGWWSPSFFKRLYYEVQVENPRITNVAVEGVHDAGKMRYDLVSSASKLMSDYFNYTLPGIQTLSLHGCALRDADLKPIFDALECNISLTRLDLSQNLLQDATLQILLELVGRKETCPLTFIGLSWNSILLDGQSRMALNNYRSTIIGKIIVVDIAYNSILEKYLPIADNFREMIVYNSEEDYAMDTESISSLQQAKQEALASSRVTTGISAFRNTDISLRRMSKKLSGSGLPNLGLGSLSDIPPSPMKKNSKGMRFEKNIKIKKVAW
tara:strand:+ start:8388 stop:11726 length:3339 start_codon:yes stop_codon:yes gene_type:complete